jgi:gluconolactonase
MHEMTTLVEGLGFTEGPAAIGDDALAFTVMSTGSIVVAQDAEVVQETYVGGGPTGIAVGADGLYIVRNCGLWGAPSDAEAGVVVVREQEVVALAVSGTTPLRAPNDICFGPDGALYFTDPITDLGLSEPVEGTVYRFDAAAQDLTPLHHGCLFPNGLAFSPDGSRLFVAESYGQRVLSLTIADGAVTNVDMFYDVLAGQPDGLCLDRQGSLWICVPNRDELHLVTPKGKRAEVIRFPEGSFPTNCCFWGDDRRHLAVTVSGRGGVVSFEPGVRGLPLLAEGR